MNEEGSPPAADRGADPEATILEPDSTSGERPSSGPEAPSEPGADPGATVFDAAEQVAVGSEAVAGTEAAFQHPEQIGPFRIVELLGEGGMGAVYLAEQSEPVQRRVALKLIHSSIRSPTALARFTAERQAMARLSHPNVAQLYEGGTTDDGFPWFAMEHLSGLPLGAYCDQKQLTIDERLELFIRICRGVQHAHQKGILHRDLKPGNLMVVEVEDRPEPKVIDFGIAKAVDQDPLTGDAEPLTQMGAIGTPAYMSPEALAGSGDLDTRSDVYSLGIVLYELLAGVRPRHQEEAMASFFDSGATGTEPERPSTRITGLEPTVAGEAAEKRRLTVKELAKRVSGDLDWIVMKAIAEEPDRRYASAAELAADLGRYLANEPVEARPPTTRYRVGKFVRRHRLAVSAAALLATALVLGIVGTSLAMVRARRAEAEAVAQAERADHEAKASEQVSVFLTDLFKVSDPGEAQGNTVTARELLDVGARRLRTELVEQPLLRARMMRTIGGVYENLGLYEQAVSLEEEALDFLRSTLGTDHPDIGRSLNAVGNLYNLQGHYERAEPLHRQAIEVLEATVGADHPDVAEGLAHLARTSQFLGRSEEAESLYRRVLAIRQKAFGPDHPEVAKSLVHLGWLFINLERYEEAEEMLTPALRIRENALGANHFLVAESLDVLADLFFFQGRYEEAEVLRLRALAVKEKVFEPDHPDIAESLFALGWIYQNLGRPEEAERTLLRGLEVGEAALGADNPSLTRGLDRLGMVLVDQGRWRDAVAAFRREATISETTLGPDHEWVGQALNNLGWALSDGLRDYQEGERVLRRAVAIFSPDSGERGFWSALTRWSLANNLRDQERFDEAEPVYAEALAILEAVGGSRRLDNPQLPEFLADYGKMLRAAGRDAEAIALEKRGSE